MVASTYFVKICIRLEMQRENVVVSSWETGVYVFYKSQLLGRIWQSILNSTVRVCMYVCVMTCNSSVADGVLTKKIVYIVTHCLQCNTLSTL